LFADLGASLFLFSLNGSQSLEAWLELPVWAEGGAHLDASFNGSCGLDRLDLAQLVPDKTAKDYRGEDAGTLPTLYCFGATDPANGELLAGDKMQGLIFSTLHGVEWLVADGLTLSRP
jgi:hypothetical protein